MITNTAILVGNTTDFSKIKSYISKYPDAEIFSLNFKSHEKLSKEKISHEIAENFLNDEELTMGNDVSQLVIQGEDGSLSDFLLLRSWINSGWDESLSGGPAKFILANHSVRADALFLEAPEEPALKCKRGIASTSGWVAEQEVNREQNYDGYGVLNVSYFVTLAAAGIKALGSTVLDVAAGRSHVICKNMRGACKGNRRGALQR